MNNPNMYNGKKNKPSYFRFIPIWIGIFAIIVTFLVLAFKSSGVSQYTWNINEIKYALTTINDGNKVDEEDFKKYNFDRQNIKEIKLNVGYIKSNIVISYVSASDNRVKQNVASFEWSSNDNGEYLLQIQNACADFDTYYKKTFNKTTSIVSIKDTTNTFSFVDFLIYVLPTLITIIIAVVLIRSILKSQGGAGQTFDFGKSKARLEDASPIRFSDVAGCDDEKEEMKEIVDYLKNPKKYARSGARIPKGVILKGNPGTGKTLLAKAVAGEASVPFYYISGSDFLEMFVGVGASRVRDMFKKARSTAPCIIFIDEIDAIGRQRGTGLGGGHDEREQTLNQLLVEMDGFESNSGVIVLAATNRIDVLDPALLRPGRFDRQIEVGLPDIKGRIAILKVHARNKKLASDVSLESVAKRTPGFSGAQLENVLNEAAILSVRANHEVISVNDIDEAIDRVMSGPAKKTKIRSDHAKRLTAYHEAGHAVIGLKIANAEVVQKITIIPRGDAYGYVLMTPKDETMNQTRSELMDRIVSYLAGRASEEIFFDDVTTGAYDDIKRATSIARAMVTELGMSSLGPIHYEDEQQQVFLGRDYGSQKISVEVSNQIDAEVRAIIHECLQRAKETIEANKDLLILIAEALIKYETITADEIDFLVKYGSLDAYDEFKKNSENLAKGGNATTNTTTTVEAPSSTENNEKADNEASEKHE